MSGVPGATGRTRRWRRPKVIAPVAGIALLGLVGALLAFEPWTLFTNQVVDEARPPASTQSIPGPSATSTSPSESESPAPVEPVVLASGSFISHEHATSGDVRLLRLPDGSRVLRIEGLDTSNGPDLHVWITDAPVAEGRDGWFVFDDGTYVELGALKGNRGSQNYAVPADADLSSLPSVTIWCKRFHVSFGAAQLA